MINTFLYFYLVRGSNIFFEKFNFPFYFVYNKVIFLNKRFIYLSGSEKKEGFFNNLSFFRNIRHGFARNNYLVPLALNNYDFVRSEVPFYSLFFFTSFRFLYFYKYFLFFKFFFDFFIIYNFIHFFNFFLKNLFFYFNLLSFYKRYLNIFGLFREKKEYRLRLLKKIKRKKKRKLFKLLRKKRLFKKKLRFLKRCYLIF